jgi:cell division protein FtsL
MDKMLCFFLSVMMCVIIFNLCQIIYYTYQIHQLKIKTNKLRQKIYDEHGIRLPEPPAF